MERRGQAPFVPPPMRVLDDVIERCRVSVDHPVKAKLRCIINFLYKRLKGIEELGEGFQLSRSVFVPKLSRLGCYGYIGSGFKAESPVVIGDLTMISTNVHLVANDHGVDDIENPMRLAFRWRHQVTIFEADVWVGHGAVIKSGINIGRGSVIGAGAVVTKDVEPYSIVAGNPARLIRMRFENSQENQYEKMLFGDQFKI